MGTSRAFYNVFNTGVTPEDLAINMREIQNFNKSAADRHNRGLERLLPPEELEKARAIFKQMEADLGAAYRERQKERRPVIAYDKTAKWLPLFEENLCEGCEMSDDTLKWLYRVFGAPVLAFMIFDSDVLYVSYIDDKSQVHNYDFSTTTPSSQDISCSRATILT